MSEEQEKVFVDLVKSSWKIHRACNYASSVDEVFLGGVIAGTVNVGFSLIDLNSDGTRHYLRFENLEDRERLTFELYHRTGDIVKAKVLGHVADVTIGYGVKGNNLSTLWSSFKQELKSAMIIDKEPGVITVDADMAGGYLYAQVPMIWDLDDYVPEDYCPNYDLIGEHVDATALSLKKYLNGRLALN